MSLCVLSHATQAFGIIAFDSLMTEAVAKQSLLTQVYFPFVTLTTIGYGDYSPDNRVSRLFGICWLIPGLVYMTGVLNEFSRLVIMQQEDQARAHSAKAHRRLRSGGGATPSACRPRAAAAPGPVHPVALTRLGRLARPARR